VHYTVYTDTTMRFVFFLELDRFAFYGQGSSKHHPVIITGDFNLTPDSFVFDFISSGNCYYEGVSSKTLDNYGPGPYLGRALLPSYLGVTDSCQHFDVVNERSRGGRDKAREEVKGRLYHSESNHNPVEPKSRDPLLSMDPLPGGGGLSHAFGLRSAYNPYLGPKAVS
jgi:hypothetical protein